MNKQEVIQLCKALLSQGIYSRPLETRYYGWMIVINHTADSFGYELAGYKFQDCTFTRFEGMHTQDYPIFYRA
jgi:hypothetical protein